MKTKRRQTIKEIRPPLELYFILQLYQIDGKILTNVESEIIMIPLFHIKSIFALDSYLKHVKSNDEL